MLNNGLLSTRPQARIAPSQYPQPEVQEGDCSYFQRRTQIRDVVDCNRRASTSPCGQDRSSRFSDWISDSEWVQLREASDHLGQAWRKAGRKLFDDNEASPPPSTTLREWEKFCYAEWTAPNAPDAVRAFMSAVISPDLSADIKKALGRHRLSGDQLRSRYFYTELYDFATKHLADNKGRLLKAALPVNRRHVRDVSRKGM